ncbi:MAG TPA: right-handed parallel beta-helix repeat-containing protein [Vicinamibacterales bacterium]
MRRYLVAAIVLCVVALSAQAIGFSAPLIVPGVPFKIVPLGYTVDPVNTQVTVAMFSDHVRFVGLADSCTVSGSSATCPGVKDLTFSAVADDTMSGSRFQIMVYSLLNGVPEGDATIDWATVYRTFFVTDTVDSLAGAIDQANLACRNDQPCMIAFRLGTPPESGYFTIRPKRGLPKITGTTISIDGTTQTGLTGDTNPDGPEVFIDGSDSASEDAIVFDEPCGAELAGLAIGNFRNAAVTMNGNTHGGHANDCTDSLNDSRSVHDNYLGVDPSGTHAAPNGRGVVLNETIYSATAFTNNLISGNHRSGIWIGVAADNAISGNTIGIDIHHQPLGNGASGIFVGPNASRVDISGNYIAFNHDFGIAIDRRSFATEIGPNSIFANGQPGIDIGLDGPTPDSETVPAPAVLSAHYDPTTDRTVIVLSSNETAPSVHPPKMTIYASDAPHSSGYGDGQYLLGNFEFDGTQGNVTFAAIGDWSGKWVAATVTRSGPYDSLAVARPNAQLPGRASTTSEFSRAVKVE